MSLIAWCVFGLIVGAIARFLMPGRDAMGCLPTILLGVAGSMVGGFIGNFLAGRDPQDFHAGGYIASILGAMLVLFFYNRFVNRAPGP